jgi:hypothetical protein
MALATVLLPTLNAVSFRASLDASLIYANEQATLSLVVENAQPAVAPRPTPVPGLQFRAAGQSEGVRIINGQRTQSLTYSYLVEASQPGHYFIPPIRIRIAGQELSTDPIELRVLPAETILPQERSAFLRLAVPRTNLFVGETLPIELRLYARHGSLRDIPQLHQEGLTLGRIHQHPVRKTRLSGIEYSLVSFETYISPARSGYLTLGPAELPMSLPVEGGRTDLFGRPLESRQVLIPSQTVTLHVASLPDEGRPPDWNGAVGDYSLAVRVSTNAVITGEPITLTVQVAGGGPIESLQLPSLDHWTEFRVYPPVSQVTTTDSFGLQGVKTFDQVIIPKSHTVRSIPPVHFSYFHPESRTYRTLTHPATPITVRPVGLAATQPTDRAASNTSVDPPDEPPRLAHIKPRLGLQANAQPPFLYRPWFLAAQALPLAAWLSAWVWRRRQNQLDANPRLLRRRHVARLTREGIAQLHQHALHNQAAEFFALLFRLLQEQLGEKLDRPAAAITESVLDDDLDPLPLQAVHVQLLRQLFQLSHQIRFAPQTAHTPLTELIPRAVELLEKLESIQTPEPS